MKHIFIIMTALLLFLCSPLTYAATETFSSTGEYIMESNESIKQAQDTALREALRQISQQATVVVKSHSVSSDNQLTNDEVEMVTATILQVKEKKFQKSLEANDKIKVTAFVKAELDIERAEQMSKKLMASRNIAKDYEKIQTEYLTAQSQYNSLQGQYSVAVRKSAKYKTREGIKLEREGKIAEALQLYEEAVAVDANYAQAYSRRGHIYRQQGKFDLAQKDYDKAAAIDSKEAGAHYGKAILLEKSGQNEAAAKEYCLFIENSDILEYDREIPVVLDKIIELEGI